MYAPSHAMRGAMLESHAVTYAAVSIAAAASGAAARLMPEVMSHGERRHSITHISRAAAASTATDRSIRIFGSSKMRSARGSNRDGTMHAATRHAAVPDAAANSAALRSAASAMPATSCLVGRDRDVLLPISSFAG